MSVATIEAMPEVEVNNVKLSTINPEGFGNKQWSTFLSKMDGVVSKNMFEMFDPEQVMDRLKSNRPDLANQMVAVTKEVGGNILTINKEGFQPIQPRAVATRAMELFPDASLSYGSGAVTITDKIDMPGMSVGGEGFSPMWNIKYHSDGYGKNAWTAFLMRLVCSNGMMMRDALTSANMNIGNMGSDQEKLESLSRLMVSAQQPDKAYALVERLDEVQGVFASVRELNQLKNAAFVDGVGDNEGVNAWTSKWLFDTPIGQLRMSGARAARTATNIPLYDILNISSEVASHSDPNKMSLKMGELTASILKKGPDLCTAIGKHEVTEFRSTFLKEDDVAEAQSVSDSILTNWLDLLAEA